MSLLGFLKNKRICVTGGAGFLGRAVCEKLADSNPAEVFVPRSKDFDFTSAPAVARMFDSARPDVVIHLAAEVGGIGANQLHPGRFFYANMAMGLNLIEESRRRGVQKFIQVGTVCAYPKFCAAPFREEDLWNGFPEETNAAYGIAKRALGVMLDAYRREYDFNGIYLIPVNLYGPGDNFDLETSHVIAALIRKFCAAVQLGQPTVSCWGTGNASREFLYVDDAAEAILLAAENHNDPAPINLGTGREIIIRDLAELIADMCGYEGGIEWDAARVDGQPRRNLNTDRAQELLAWRAKVSLEDGLRRTVAWWKENLPVESPSRIRVNC